MVHRHDRHVQASIFNQNNSSAGHRNYKKPVIQDNQESVEALKAIGVVKYDSFITDGYSEYLGIDNQKIFSPPVYKNLTIVNISNREDLLTHLNLHERGKTDYLEMSQGLADSGIEKWSFDTNKMIITYYDKEGIEKRLRKVFHQAQ